MSKCSYFDTMISWRMAEGEVYINWKGKMKIHGLGILVPKPMDSS
jgi:hypothetical protein